VGGTRPKPPARKHSLAQEPRTRVWYLYAGFEQGGSSRKEHNEEMTKRTLAAALMTLAVMLFSINLLAQSDSSPTQGQAPEGHKRGDMSRRGAMMSPQARLDHMAQALNLTDDQKNQIKPILEDESTQMQNLRQDTSLSQQDRFAKMREIHENTLSKIKPILNADQQAKLDAMGPGKGHGSHDRQHGTPPNPQ
jgi:periplasmic protein CpxP/Spy